MTSRQRLVLLVLLATFFFITAASAVRQSPTYDEVRNFNYGKSILNGNSTRPGDRSVLDGTRIDGSMMPVSALNAVPIQIAKNLAGGNLKMFMESILAARLITILFSLCTAVLLFHWSRSLYGVLPAFISLTLYIFDPNIIAHSQFVTTDMFTWGATLLVFYSSWRFAKERTIKNGALWGMALGLSSLVKYTTIVLLPLSLATIIFYDLPNIISALRARARIAPYAVKYLQYLTGAVFACLIFINAGFLFNQSFYKFGDYEFSSSLMSGIQQFAPWLTNFPTPVPLPYIEGFDLTYYYSEAGLAFGNIYLLGELRDGTQGFTGYYVIASLLKQPIATQFLVLVALIFYVLKGQYRKSFMRDEIFLILPSLFFFVYFNFGFNINIGIRYYLVFFPLIYVFCGSPFTEWDIWKKPAHLAVSALTIWLAISVLSAFPNYVPYFNEFVRDQRNAYKFLADSNIDYGQSDSARDRFLVAHPEAILNPPHPTAGTLVVGVNELVGVFGDVENYRWLRENFEPVDTIADTWLVYEISPSALNDLCESTNFCD